MTSTLSPPNLSPPLNEFQCAFPYNRLDSRSATWTFSSSLGPLRRPREGERKEVPGALTTEGPLYPSVALRGAPTPTRPGRRPFAVPGGPRGAPPHSRPITVHSSHVSRTPSCGPRSIRGTLDRPSVGRDASSRVGRPSSEGDLVPRSGPRPMGRPATMLGTAPRLAPLSRPQGPDLLCRRVPPVSGSLSPAERALS